MTLKRRPALPSRFVPPHRTRDLALTSPLQIFAIFLRLGLTSFGGPIAHLGYFREEFVGKRKWLDDATYSNLIALSQFVPGPASSQTGFAIGVMRGGLAGGLMAWLGFTLPSALLMLLAAKGLVAAEGPHVAGLIHGLKIVAVAVVAQAVWSMAKTLCPDRRTASIALVAAAVLVAAASGLMQLAVIAAGAVAGVIFLSSRPQSEPPSPLTPSQSKTAAILALALFCIMLLGLPLLARLEGSNILAMIEVFYRAGALVFGGGHVVLPLLEQAVVPPGWLSHHDFLAGYGAAQALPGPLFTFAAYLGALVPQELGEFAGSGLAVLAIFLPGLLLIYGALPYWSALSARRNARAAIAGVNAAVVGVLAAALYHPIFTSAIAGPYDAALALAAFTALTVWRLPVFAVVSATAAAGLGITLVTALPQG